MPLYRKLRGALAENGKRICDLAEYLNVEPMTISQWMVGRTQWRVDEAYTLLGRLTRSARKIIMHLLQISDKL